MSQKSSKNLLDKTRELEDKFLTSTFLAPVRGEVAVRISGLTYKLDVNPPGFEGWAVLKPKDFTTAIVTGDPQPHQIYDYLKNFPSLRCILLKKIKGKTWLALPFNLSDSMQRFRIKKPFLVHLVERGDVFEHIRTVHDGASFWFESIDTGVSLEKTEKMREGITKQQEEIQFKDLTREEKMAYSFVLSTVKEELVDREERKIKNALKRAGAELSSYSEAEGGYVVKWKFEGEEYTTVVRKEDLTVTSAGFCLSGRDELFDLTSIISVRREYTQRRG